MRTSMTYKLANLARKSGHKFNEQSRPEVIKMNDEIALLDNKTVSFETTAYPDGSWISKSTNVEGILTGGRDVTELHEMLKDAVLTYYGIPALYSHDFALRSIGEPVRSEQEVHSLA